jgi:hypothetical protein
VVQGVRILGIRVEYKQVLPGHHEAMALAQSGDECIADGRTNSKFGQALIPARETRDSIRSETPAKICCAGPRIFRTMTRLSSIIALADLRRRPLVSMKIPRRIYFCLLVCANLARGAQDATPGPSLPFAAATPAPFAQTPLLGWSSWTSLRLKIDEAAIKAQADVLAAKLKPAGFIYLNLDDGWYQGCDEHGRLKADPKKFPGGLATLAAYIHEKGLKFGIYLTPGLRKEAWKANGTVAGTDIHLQDIADITQQGNTKGDAYHIDYTKPGAVEFIQGYADLLASWGVDYIKMDFVGPGGGRIKADNRDDIKQWAAALKKCGRPIWLELSNSLSFENADVWKANSNGWRIESDIEKYGTDGELTTWSKVARRFADAPKWAPYGGPGAWNDLDSLEIGNGENDGITSDERQSMMTLWAISCSPLLLGADLTKLDDADLAMLTNAEVLAIDQQGHIATPLAGQAQPQVWRAKNPDGSFTVALFNLGEADAKISVQWSDLGLAGPAAVRDLWSHHDLGKFTNNYEAALAPHACQLLHVAP